MRIFTRTFYFSLIVISSLLLSKDAFAIKHVIQVADYQFSPNSLTGIMVGDTVRWEWQDGSHTTTSTSVPSGAATWDAPLNSNNTSFEYRVLVAGDYAFKCTPHESMGMTGTFSVINVPTGIAQATPEESAVNFYPNPVGSNVKISISNGKPSPGMLKVYDVKGQVVMQVPFTIREGENILDFPVASLNQGMYIFEVSNSDERLAMKPITKE